MVHNQCLMCVCVFVCLMYFFLGGGGVGAKLLKILDANKFTPGKSS